jgi:hypothetical protein
MRERVAAGLGGLDATIVAVSPIPTTNRVTVSFVLDATSEEDARERVTSAIRKDDRFGALGWSIVSFYSTRLEGDS